MTWRIVPLLVVIWRDQPTGYATSSTCFHTPEITITRDGTEFDELWFKRMIAKTILFRAMEKAVSAAEWYEGGYRANIVTYGIAKVVHDAKQRGRLIDLDTIWRQQRISSDLQEVLLIAGRAAQNVIMGPPEGVRNFSEWAKKEICWKWLSERSVKYPPKLDRVLISSEMASSLVREARAEKAVDNSVNAEIEVHRLGSTYWTSLRDWARGRDVLTPKEIGVVDTCAAIPRKMPSEKQCTIALASLEKAKSEGFESGLI